MSASSSLDWLNYMLSPQLLRQIPYSDFFKAFVLLIFQGDFFSALQKMVGASLLNVLLECS
jgi:hypothetical protein